ncbi:CDP-glycerol glycerophosphotransferase family protein [Faecalicatena contorta]|uniref:CDP-glycerol glycerophosphotransferase n=1 Tax=Faecalicatena contorta TaxID=39482 RepID=A0A315ZS36_9FIRM|nr:CDP-glycerol glycerophosphotransferase family protein [Faecalicatena contorta]PWJ48365.1 CDP-glycerol glycerophosphotransferase [Faecalicatena contorta]SUQ15388.1 CDP-glycerol glycerophosphotransferase [Faecalicatena contorta]
MIDNLTTTLAGILRHILKILSIGRFHKKRVVFFSYFGSQYSCNPKYISQYLHEHMPEFEIVWAFVCPHEFRNLEAKNIKTVKYNSLSFLRICLTSRYIITNSEIPAWFPLTGRQTLINTWHGGGAYKKVGAAYQKETIGKQKRAQIARKNPCIYLSSSRAFSEMTLQQSFLHTGDILTYGMPRNDMLIKQNREDLYEKVKNFYNIPAENHILLYAPTYRESKKASEYLFNCTKMRQVLTQRFGGDWSILFRMHYFIMEQLEFSEEYIDASQYSDMQELLYVSDILITDYSSSMWDFALMNKPCFLFATDLNHYDLSRGFYTDIHTWPYPLAENIEELLANIQNFNNILYSEDVQKHFNDLGNLESGDSAKKVCEYMLKNL